MHLNYILGNLNSNLLISLWLRFPNRTTPYTLHPAKTYLKCVLVPNSLPANVLNWGEKNGVINPRYFWHEIIEKIKTTKDDHKS